MCGRFTLAKSMEELQLTFPEVEFDLNIPERYNISPGQQIIGATGKEQKAQSFRWGLSQNWKQEKGSPIINARVETLSEKPTFQPLVKEHRCILFADGFYEWDSQGKPY